LLNRGDQSFQIVIAFAHAMTDKPHAGGVAADFAIALDDRRRSYE